MAKYTLRIPRHLCQEQFDLNSIPSSLCCKISFKIFYDPVFTTDGHTYEREVIEKWLTTNNTSPNTGAVLASKILTPNWDKKSTIDEFLNLEMTSCLRLSDHLYFPDSILHELINAICDNSVAEVKRLLNQDGRLVYSHILRVGLDWIWKPNPSTIEYSTFHFACHCRSIETILVIVEYMTVKGVDLEYIKRLCPVPFELEYHDIINIVYLSVVNKRDNPTNEALSKKLIILGATELTENEVLLHQQLKDALSKRDQAAQMVNDLKKENNMLKNCNAALTETNQIRSDFSKDLLLERDRAAHLINDKKENDILKDRNAALTEVNRIRSDYSTKSSPQSNRSAFSPSTKLSTLPPPSFASFASDSSKRNPFSSLNLHLPPSPTTFTGFGSPPSSSSTALASSTTTASPTTDMFGAPSPTLSIGTFGGTSSTPFVSQPLPGELESTSSAFSIGKASNTVKSNRRR